MLHQEQLQKRKQRSRGDSVSTFPEEYRRASGDPGKDPDIDIDEILRQNAEVYVTSKDEMRKNIGHLGIEAA